MFTKKALTSAILAGVAILGLSSIAYADQPGYYITGQVGDSDSHFGNGFDGTGIAGGIFGGYQFNPYIATELGYVRLHNSSLSVYSPIPSSVLAMPYYTTATIKQQAGEAAVKGIIPLANGFSLYGKGGIAYVDSQGFVSGFGSVTSSQDWRPLYGAGVSYDITQNVTADVSWTRIQNNSNIPNLDLAAVGLTYYFG